MEHNEELSNLAEQAVGLLPRIGRYVARDDQFRSKEFELSLSQLRFLNILQADREVTMGKLSESLHVAPPSATTTAERLVKQGLIVRRESSHDRRVVRIVLSPKGKALMQKIADAKRRRWLEIMGMLSPDDRQNLVATLQRLLSLLEKADEAAHSKKS